MNFMSDIYSLVLDIFFFIVFFLWSLPIFYSLWRYFPLFLSIVKIVSLKFLSGNLAYFRICLYQFIVKNSCVLIWFISEFVLSTYPFSRRKMFSCFFIYWVILDCFLNIMNDILYKLWILTSVIFLRSVLSCSVLFLEQIVNLGWTHIAKLCPLKCLEAQISLHFFGLLVAYAAHAIHLVTVYTKNWGLSLSRIFHLTLPTLVA